MNEYHHLYIGTRKRMMRTVWIALIPTISVALVACRTGPQERSEIVDAYVIEAVGDSKSTQEDVTVEDLGEVREVLQPVTLQACDDENPRRLKFAIERSRVTNRVTGQSQIVEQEVAVMESVDPLAGIYVRRLRINNDTEHTLRLNQIATLLIDPTGQDNEALSREFLYQNIRARRPCDSTNILLDSLSSLKLMTTDTDMKVLPGRRTEVYVAFQGVDQSILGDWMLSLYDFPVATDQAGAVSRRVQFQFPLLSRGYRTIVKYRKEGFLSSWEEVGRTTEELDPGTSQ